MLPVVSGFVSATAARAGLPEADADHLARAVDVVARNVIDNAFESEGAGEYEVALARRPGQVVAAVEDRGIPFDYERLEAGEDSSFAEMLRHAFADEARFVNQGRRGN